MAARSALARRTGFDEQQINELFEFEQSDWPPAKKAALAYARALMKGREYADDEIYAELQRHFTDKQIVEISVLIALCLGFIPAVIPSWGI